MQKVDLKDLNVNVRTWLMSLPTQSCFHDKVFVLFFGLETELTQESDKVRWEFSRQRRQKNNDLLSIMQIRNVKRCCCLFLSIKRLLIPQFF